MLTLHAELAALVHALTADRTMLSIESIALRPQLSVLQRAVRRPRIEDGDRAFWILMKRFFSEWAELLVIAKPETVIAWYRKRFAYYWKRKSQRRASGGRPMISEEAVELIRRMSTENVSWGSLRIKKELAKRGHVVSKSTVEKYMVKRDDNGRARPTRRTFIHNHLTVSAACDFFTVPSLTFNVPCFFVVHSHDRRRIAHVNVTCHPSAEWTAQQLVEAFSDGGEPRFLHRGRDSICGEVVRRKLRSLHITEVVSSWRSPWQSCFGEPVIGTLRRERAVQIMPLVERHLLRVLREYVDTYNNAARCHGSLDGDALQPRPIEVVVEVVARPILGGLHHRYGRKAG